MAKCAICEKGQITGHRISIERSQVSRRANRKWKPNVKKVKIVEVATLKSQVILVQNYLPSHGNGNPLQCSCLENPRDGEAWWAAVYRVAQSWTRLKQLSSSSSRNNYRVSYLHYKRFVSICNIAHRFSTVMQHT